MYLVMEWLVGEDLSEHLRRGPLTVAESGEFLTSAVRALAYIHQRGVMHLDIKPSNLFLRHFHLHEVTLIDFGLSRQVLLQSEYNSKIVDPAQLRCGTPYYVAPYAPAPPHLSPSSRPLQICSRRLLCLSSHWNKS